MRTRRGRIAIAALCAAGTLAVPATASSEITISDGDTGEVVLTGDEAPDSETVDPSETFQTFIVSASGGTSSHCTESMMLPGLWSCPFAGVSAVTVNLGGGSDTGAATGSDPEFWPEGIELSVNGGRGPDDLRGGAGDDSIRGGAGKDKLRGITGSDKLNTKDGQKDQRIDCGPGDDPNAKVDGKDPKPKSC